LQTLCRCVQTKLANNTILMREALMSFQAWMREALMSVDGHMCVDAYIFGIVIQFATNQI
jgi:hypothetical protein